MKVRAEETRKHTAAVQLVLIDAEIIKAIDKGHTGVQTSFLILSEVERKLLKLGYKVLDEQYVSWGNNI